MTSQCHCPPACVCVVSLGLEERPLTLFLWSLVHLGSRPYSTVVNPLTVVMAARRISAFHLEVARRQLAPVDLVTTLEILSLYKETQSGGGLITAQIFVELQVLLYALLINLNG